MRFVKTFIKIIIFAAGLSIAVWVFMPWGRIGEYAVLSAENAAAARGFTVQHSSVNGSWVGPTVNVNELVAKMFFGGGAFKNLSFSPAIFASVIKLSPVIFVSFSGGELSLPGGVVASLGSGSLEIYSSNGMVVIDKVKSAGEISLEGSLAIDPAKAKIDRADLTIKTPEKLQHTFSSMKSMLPLEDGGGGTWKLKRDPGNG